MANSQVNVKDVQKTVIDAIILHFVPLVQLDLVQFLMMMENIQDNVGLVQITVFFVMQIIQNAKKMVVKKVQGQFLIAMEDI